MRASTRLIALGLCIMSTGCSLFNRQVGDPIGQQHARFEDDRTTVRDVVAALGPPTKLSALPDGLVMLYEHLDISERQFGISLSFANLQFFKVSTGRGNVAREALVLLFDHDGVLRNHRFDAWSEPPATGAALQLFITAAPTVDVNYLLGPAEQHGWGMSMLGSLPVTLNAGQSVQGGERGLEMRGTPTSAGQRTLELDD